MTFLPPPPPAPAAQGVDAPMDFADAYRGARDDLLMWKGRALAAEKALSEEREVTDRLWRANNEMNGPTFMGEPVLRQPNAETPAASYCSDERPCIPCFADQGRCEEPPAETSATASVAGPTSLNFAKPSATGAVVGLGVDRNVGRALDLKDDPAVKAALAESVQRHANGLVCGTTHPEAYKPTLKPLSPEKVRELAERALNEDDSDWGQAWALSDQALQNIARLLTEELQKVGA